MKTDDTVGDHYVAVDWMSWMSGILIQISINQEHFGEFKYNIEYYDDQN